jgi:hypothetical protein
MEIRTKEQIFYDLSNLIHSKGYIYFLCLILFEDFHLDLNKIHTVGHKH